jgi:hypothetical protein
MRPLRLLAALVSVAAFGANVPARADPSPAAVDARSAPASADRERSEAQGSSRGGSERPREALGATVTFKYEQRRFLYSRNGPGGLAYVPRGAPADEPLPIVVFLHGMNPEGIVHMWFGPPYGDLRPVVDDLVASGRAAPFVLAAPTHTRFATGAAVMWHDLDLADFVDATERALGGAAHVDRERVVVVGHSGGGCNPTGGIFAEPRRGRAPLEVLAVDTCIDDKTIPAFAELSRRTRVRVYWQRTWTRPVGELERACAACKVEEIADLGPAGHVRILPEVLRRALPEILPPP